MTMGLFDKLFGRDSIGDSFSDDVTDTARKFKVVVHYPDGTSVDEDELFDTWEAAEAAGLYALTCIKVGGEVLHMSNPGDNPLDDETAEFEIVEL